MNTYRPDLARSLSREELLALRFDPTISREMVRNLAREGEAYLKARGHQITAGRLYLCHFLGMEGAHVVLSSPGDAMLVNVLGSSVIQANPSSPARTPATSPVGPRAEDERPEGVSAVAADHRHPGDQADIAGIREIQEGDRQRGRIPSRK